MRLSAWKLRQNRYYVPGITGSGRWLPLPSVEGQAFSRAGRNGWTLLGDYTQGPRRTECCGRRLVIARLRGLKHKLDLDDLKRPAAPARFQSLVSYACRRPAGAQP